MARKTNTVTITAAGRDQGKQFLLTEMPATEGEDWAIRAFLALSNSGIEVPPEVAAMGMAGLPLVTLQLLGKLRYELAKPLLDQMLRCVQMVEPQMVRPLTSADVEEIATFFTLRKEVLALHVDFSAIAALFHSGAAAVDSDAPAAT